MAIHKVIEVLSQSEKTWEEAAQRAVKDAAKNVRHIKSIYIKSMVGPERERVLSATGLCTRSSGRRGGSPPRPHLPHRLVCRNSGGAHASIRAMGITEDDLPVIQPIFPRFLNQVRNPPHIVAVPGRMAWLMLHHAMERTDFTIGDCRHRPHEMVRLTVIVHPSVAGDVETASSINIASSGGPDVFGWHWALAN